MLAALAAGPLVKGMDAVLAAETGSGKTLAYLGPLLSRWSEGDAGSVLVLAPTKTLCSQVAAVGAALLPGRPPWIATARQALPRPPPRLVVSTPGSLARLLSEADAEAELLRSARSVVLDECDLLLGGSYGRDMERVLSALRAADRAAAREAARRSLGLTPEAFDALPLRVRRAAAEPDGARAARELLGRAEPAAPAPSAEPTHRQYVFVGATLPREGDREVGTRLRAGWPAAVWLEGPRLHRGLARAEYVWTAYRSAAQRAALLQAAVDRLPRDATALVFARDAASARQTYEALRPALARATSRSSRTRPPSTARPPRVLVLTDGVARGLDLPGVTHVIQADFARSAVDFIHRAGRTARAGRGGTVVSLYDEDQAPLVQALRQGIARGESLEGAFSRKRSFRKKFKRYGKFVPRGQLSAD
ncbi:hypothetical protein QBZ16_004307 [Prototheca wickerhamii]|uniref:ATP-dependent RNA helicase n=1 Tax=Prototheca wickerhamii TaxID=3111 RepID=A0AAD9MHW6_PROWI|nr:hypothetical protein QBZ16_004307 [Prototheca wickerhamii]